MTDPVRDLREEVAKLQAQLAFQEDAVASLDTALAQQQKDILTLRRQVALLHERQAQFVEQSAADPLLPAEDKPPHY